ncbi:formate/nitrite transporter family protein, partial [Vibrio cholerae]|nr:formate/nitrite transporter family protein [Vibrio cholerae]
LANLMVCLAVWMTYAGRSVTDKILAMLLPVAMFVASGFEHSIANMFMIPMGIVIHSFASPEFWTAMNVDPAQFADLTVSHFVFNNLIPVTIGNIIGGALLVGMMNWVIFLRGEKVLPASLRTALSQETPQN